MIKFILIKFENALLFQIVEQNLHAFHLVGTNFNIGSHGFPAINLGTSLQIRLRGREKFKDNYVVIRKFANNDVRNIYYIQILKAFKILKSRLPIDNWPISDIPRLTTNDCV